MVEKKRKISLKITKIKLIAPIESIHLNNVYKTLEGSVLLPHNFQINLTLFVELFVAKYFPVFISPQREKRLNTVPYFTVLGQIISIYRHTKTVYGNIRGRIQAFFMQWPRQV